MEKNLLNSKSVEQSVKAATGKEQLTQVEGVEEIVIYDECGDTLWDKVLAQDTLVYNLKQKMPE